MKNKNSSYIESLDTYDFEDEGFTEGDIIFGKAIASFNFNMNSDNPISATSSTKPISNILSIDYMPDTQSYKGNQRGITPAIDGEMFTLKRCYQFRESTVRKLNELKAKHMDVNVYLNTIIDEAISHYYDYIFKENGCFYSSNS